MGGCRCTFRNCVNNSANSPGLHFFTFPLKNSERCQKWVMYSDNPSFTTMPALKLRNKVVCEKHFRDECFMNYKKDRLVSTAIPTLFPLSNGLVLDYEESSNPEPKKLEPTTQKHLIPPTNFQQTKEFDEEQFSIIEEQSLVGHHATYIIEELETPDEENVEVVEAFDIVIGAPKQKIRKLDETVTPSQSHLPKILNKVTVSRKIPTKSKTFATNRSAVTLSANAADVSQHSAVCRTSDSDDSHKSDLDFRLNQNFSNKKIGAYKEVKTVSTDPVIEKPDKCGGGDIEAYESDGSQNITELKTINALPPEEESTKQQSTSQETSDREADDTFIHKEKYLETIAEHDKQIKALEKLLLESEAKKGLPKTGTQVETISTSRKTESLGTGGITKQQLFNGIKKYLTPSMVSFVRMEMFGGPDREWKSDEKTVAVELLQLGDHVFDYVRDEWRFRLPPKKDVEKWQKEYSNYSEEEDF